MSFASTIKEIKKTGCMPNSLLTSESCNPQLDTALFNEQWQRTSAPASFNKNQAARDCELVKTIYTKHSELAEQFSTDTPYHYPALIITQDKRKRQNTDIFKLQTDSQPVVVNRNPACVEPFNIRQLNDATGLQAGYARNIDLDSELRRINHMTDKCYYDNYKLHPNEAAVGNGLYCHKQAIVKDYTKVGRAECILPYPGDKYQSAITPPQYQAPYEPKCGMFTNNVRYGDLTRELPTDNLNIQACRSQPPTQQYCTKLTTQPTKCTNMELQQQLDTNAKRIIEYRESLPGGLVPEYYQFNGNPTDATAKFNRNYPCQRMFNNFTKRSTLPNLLNTFDINPKCL